MDLLFYLNCQSVMDKNFDSILSPLPSVLGGSLENGFRLMIENCLFKHKVSAYIASSILYYHVCIHVPYMYSNYVLGRLS